MSTADHSKIHSRMPNPIIKETYEKGSALDRNQRLRIAHEKTKSKQEQEERIRKVKKD